jgi:hypothetical protein
MAGDARFHAVGIKRTEALGRPVHRCRLVSQTIGLADIDAEAARLPQISSPSSNSKEKSRMTSCTQSSIVTVNETNSKTKPSCGASGKV